LSDGIFFVPRREDLSLEPSMGTKVSQDPLFDLRESGIEFWGGRQEGRDGGIVDRGTRITLEGRLSLRSLHIGDGSAARH
jgi:hypothetical protein